MSTRAVAIEGSKQPTAQHQLLELQRVLVFEDLFGQHFRVWHDFSLPDETSTYQIIVENSFRAIGSLLLVLFVPVGG